MVMPLPQTCNMNNAHITTHTSTTACNTHTSTRASKRGALDRLRASHPRDRKRRDWALEGVAWGLHTLLCASCTSHIMPQAHQGWGEWVGGERHRCMLVLSEPMKAKACPISRYTPPSEPEQRAHIGAFTSVHPLYHP